METVAGASDDGVALPDGADKRGTVGSRGRRREGSEEPTLQESRVSLELKIVEGHLADDSQSLERGSLLFDPEGVPGQPAAYLTALLPIQAIFRRFVRGLNFEYLLRRLGN